MVDHDVSVKNAEGDRCKPAMTLYLCNGPVRMQLGMQWEGKYLYLGIKHVHLFPHQHRESLHEWLSWFRDCLDVPQFWNEKVAFWVTKSIHLKKPSHPGILLRAEALSYIDTWALTNIYLC